MLDKQREKDSIIDHAGSQRDRYSYVNRPDRFVIPTSFKAVVTIEFNIQEHPRITFQMV